MNTLTYVYLYIYIIDEQNLNIVYISIYIEREREMDLSYTWCNSIRVAPFLSHRFLRDLTVEKMSLNINIFHLIT